MVKRNRIRYLVVLLGVCLFFVFFNDYISLYILLLTAFLPLLSLLLTLPAALGLSLELTLGSSHASKGQKVPLTLSVRNRIFLASGRVRLTLSVSNTLTGQMEEEQFVFTAYPGVQTIRHELTPSACGQVICRLAKGAVVDYLGLFALPLKNADQQLTLLVYPTLQNVPLSLEHTAVLDGEWTTHSHTKPGDDPSELFGFREYREGDRVSRIHWKLSEKLDQTLVKELGLPITENLAILVELDGSGREMDALLETFATISTFLAEKEALFQVGFCGDGREALAFSLINGPEALLPVLNALLTTRRRGPIPPAAVQELPAESSHVVYLSCRPRADLMKNIRLRTPTARISLLHVTETGTRAPFRLPENSRELTITPDGLTRELRGFSL